MELALSTWLGYSGSFSAFFLLIDQVQAIANEEHFLANDRSTCFGYIFLAVAFKVRLSLERWIKAVKNIFLAIVSFLRVLFNLKTFRFNPLSPIEVCMHVNYVI